MPSRSRPLSTGPGDSCEPTSRSFRSPQDPSTKPSTAAACITSRARLERYATEVARVLRPGGRFLLRACLRAAGIRNDLDESVLRSVFVGWWVHSIVSHEIPTDDRMMQAIVARLEHV
jgi:SAM-dependent methyltransferase